MNGLLHVAAQCWIVHKTVPRQVKLIYYSEQFTLANSCHVSCRLSDLINHLCLTYFWNMYFSQKLFQMLIIAWYLLLLMAAKLVRKKQCKKWSK